jgi:hypothetical protein
MTSTATTESTATETTESTATETTESTKARLELTHITRDPEIQQRERLSRATIKQYCDAMNAGAEFPRVVVYHDGDRYLLTQGWHRCAAAELGGWESIDVWVCQGGRKKAMWDAAGSNREHDTAGMRRTNADKRRAVRLALEAKPKLSNRRIANRVGVSDKTVAAVRKAICGNSEDTPAVREVTRHNTTYHQNTENIGKTVIDGDARAEPAGNDDTPTLEHDEPGLAANAESGSEDQADGVAPRAHRPNRRTWQRTEDRVAAFFGARRAILSGSAGRTDVTASDSTHPGLFIETKQRESHALRTLYDKTEKLARKERKIPVLALVNNRRSEFLVGIRNDYFLALLVEFIAILDDEERAELDSRIAEARARWGDSEAGDGSGSGSGPVEPVENNPVGPIEGDPVEPVEGDPVGPIKGYPVAGDPVEKAQEGP